MSKLALCIRVDDEIELRLNELRYADELFALIERNREYLQEWLSWAADSTLETTQEYMKASIHNFAEGIGLPTNIWYHGQLVGAISYPRMSWEKRMAEIGYWLDQDMQGKGIMTRATRTLVTYAFQEYGLNKVEIHAAVGNKHSRAVPERLDFTQEGILRQTEWLNGKAHDMVVYGVLANEWKL
jgi:ribosomal-protein-serine acetyltransferase